MRIVVAATDDAGEGALPPTPGAYSDPIVASASAAGTSTHADETTVATRRIFLAACGVSTPTKPGSGSVYLQYLRRMITDGISGRSCTSAIHTRVLAEKK